MERMKSLKKVFAFSLLAIGLAFSLALSACGESPAASENPTPNTADSGADSSDGASSSDASAFDATQNISVIAREDGSGTKTAFMELIDLKDKADPANIIIQTGTAGVLAEVESNPTAIAYESLGYVTDAVKTLSVDGVEATVDNIKSGDYKISRPLSIVYQEANLDDAINQAFFNYLQSTEAQDIIEQAGYVTVTEAASEYTMDGSLSGTIDVSGSTSLQPLMIELASAFEAIQTNVTVNVSGGGSGTGYQNAEEGVSAFGMISEEFATEKAASCTHSVVCKDGIAVIVNSENPLTDITMAELKNMYDEEAGSNAITTWDALVG